MGSKTWQLLRSQNYPDGPSKVLGFVDWRLLQALQWDHIYTADYFLALMTLLAASLAACTSTRQWPAVRIARRRGSLMPLTMIVTLSATPLCRCMTAESQKRSHWWTANQQVCCGRYTGISCRTDEFEGPP